MTIHLTMFTPAYVLQVSDRRLTRLDTGETHPLANKNVVFLARDGIVTIGYTGVAYLERVPTDTWIACKLAGQDHRPFRDGRGPGMRVGMGGPQNDSWPAIEQAVELLEEETKAVFARLQGSQVMRHQIHIAGWQADTSGSFHPVSWTVQNTEEEPLVFTKELADKHQHHEGCSWLEVIPDQALSDADTERFKLEESLWPPSACMNSLVEIVRYVWKRDGRDGPVGPDCMAILLPNPEEERKCYFRYEPLVEGRARLAGDWQNAEVPAAFSPWFVGPQLHAPPSILMGGNIPIPPLGDYEILGYAPPLPQGGIRSGKGGQRFHGGFSTQQRPRQPRRRSK